MLAAPSSVPAAVLVTLLYWLLVFGGTTDAADVHAHAINSVVILCDLAVSRVPLYLKHFYMPFSYILVYVDVDMASTWIWEGDGHVTEERLPDATLRPNPDPKSSLPWASSQPNLDPRPSQVHDLQRGLLCLGPHRPLR